MTKYDAYIYLSDYQKWQKINNYKSSKEFIEVLDVVLELLSKAAAKEIKQTKKEQE